MAERWFMVRVRVSGGVTGTRESVMMRDGKVLLFKVREEAEWYAAKLTADKAADPFAGRHGAQYAYWVEEQR